MGCENFDKYKWTCQGCDENGMYHSVMGYCRCNNYKYDGKICRPDIEYETDYIVHSIESFWGRDKITIRDYEKIVYDIYKRLKQ